MPAKRHKFTVVLAVAVCLMAQAFVVLPHHHHGESETPCFNVAHCVAHEAEHETSETEGCCHDHCLPDREPVTGHECSVRVDIPEPVNQRQYNTPADIPATFNDLYAPEPAVAAGSDNILSVLTLTRKRQEPFVPGVCVVCLARIHAARAPSCLV